MYNKSTLKLLSSLKNVVPDCNRFNLVIAKYVKATSSITKLCQIFLEK